MDKKIAIFLIIFMVGTWCVFADDDNSTLDGDDTMIMAIIGGAAGLVGIVLIIARGGSVSEAADYYKSVTEGKSYNGNFNHPALTVLNNPIMNHAMICITDTNKVFVGMRFAW
jgi:hypothetical protein